MYIIIDNLSTSIRTRDEMSSINDLNLCQHPKSFYKKTRALIYLTSSVKYLHDYHKSLEEFS